MGVDALESCSGEALERDLLLIEEGATEGLVTLLE